MLREALLRSVDWSGRARRRELWLLLAFAGLVVVGTVAGEVWIRAGVPDAARFSYVVVAVLAVPVISLCVRRLHDLGRGGGWLALGLLPWVSLALFAYLLFAPSRGRVDEPDTPLVLHLLGAGIAGMFVLLLLSRVFWAAYWVPSGHMKPTLLPGDYVIATYAAAENLARGDVIVFRGGRDGQAQIMRLIGVADDRVAMQAGQIVLNGVTVARAPLADFVEANTPQGPGHSLPRCGNAPVGAGGVCKTARFGETLPGNASFEVLDLMPDAAMDDMAEIVVPDGGLFVLGDSRDDSLDSRFAGSIGGAGLVGAENVIGRVDRVAFSASGQWLWAFWHWRAGRIWQAVE
jgi:signal peptidase I